jgi:hypothetical protein
MSKINVFVSLGFKYVCTSLKSVSGPYTKILHVDFIICMYIACDYHIMYELDTYGCDSEEYNTYVLLQCKKCCSFE